MLYPYLTQGVVGAEGVNFVALGSLIGFVALLGGWTVWALNSGPQPLSGTDAAIATDVSAAQQDTAFIMPTIKAGVSSDVSVVGGGLLMVEATPTLQKTSVGVWYVSPSATPSPTSQYPDGWGMWAAERTLVPAPAGVVVCSSVPDGDPCASAWIEAGRADEYFERWTPTVEPSPTLPAFVTYTPMPVASATPVYVSERWSDADR